MIGQTLSHYEILAPLGAGGMGEVFRVRDTKLGREVAIKVLPEDFVADGERLARFEREVRATARLTHWNTIQIYDFGRIVDNYFIAMECVDGSWLPQLEIQATGHARQIGQRCLHRGETRMGEFVQFFAAPATRGDWFGDPESQVALFLEPTEGFVYGPQREYA